MTGEFTISSDKYAVRDRLRPALVLIYETLERCIPIVLDSIQQQGLPFSPYLFSTSIRCHLKKSLQSGGFNPEDPNDELPLTVNNVSNDGIDFGAAGLHVKMLKGPELPRASSTQREKFYQQQSQFPFAKNDFPDAPLKSVIVLWDYPTAEGFKLELVAPQSKNGARLWDLIVPAPAEWLTVHEQLDTQDEDIELPIKKKSAKANGGEDE